MQDDGRRYGNIQGRCAPAVLRDVHERVAARLLLLAHAGPLGVGSSARGCSTTTG